MSPSTSSQTTASRALELFAATEQVVGQEIARRQLATILERQWEVAEGRHKRSGGVLLSGRSGTGKTMMAEAMCAACGLPFASVNATRYTEAGYAGLDLQQMFLPLLEAAARLRDERSSRMPASDLPEWLREEPDPNVLKRTDLEEVKELAATGVVLLDEFDKWLLRVNHVTGQKDTAIQGDLLKMVEGSREFLSDNEDEVGTIFDTSRVLIICCGAFVGLEGLVGKRLELERDEQGRYPIALWEQVTQEDFEHLGLLPELAGRLAVHVFTRPLQPKDFSEVIKQPEAVIAEYRRRFEAKGCRWSIGEAGILYVAQEALKRSTGARAIEHICWRFFGEALWQAGLAEDACEVRLEPMWQSARLEAL